MDKALTYYYDAEIAAKMNELGSMRLPFIFLINFDATKAFIQSLDEVSPEELKFNFQGFTNDLSVLPAFRKKVDFQIYPIPESEYKSAFEKVLNHINFGNTYLLNLTFPTDIKTSLTLEEIYHLSDSKYKLYLRDNFVCFSPEPFVLISDNEISSFPMKGTISAEIPNAIVILQNDEKEIAEHYTIVDLLRNDLSMISKKVRVKEFRFFEEINTINGKIIQTSSKIVGELETDWHSSIGTIITKMLPAGSVTGAPKSKTLEIIKQVESYNRGFYTGVAGIFDGSKLNSCVLIRFIEKTNSGLQFKSGGGITFRSNFKSEYSELLEKIYVPTL